MSGDRLSRRNGRTPRRGKVALLRKRSRHNDVVVVALLHDRGPLNIYQIMEHGRLPFSAANRALTVLGQQGHVTQAAANGSGTRLPVYELTASGRLYCAAHGIGSGQGES